jgi:hypothetical protein
VKPHVPAVLPPVVLLGACSGRGADTAYEKDLETLQGTWHPVSMEQDGEGSGNLLEIWEKE